jgi:hypothetical protein
MLEIKQKVLDAMRQGKSSDVLTAKLTAPYDSKVSGGLDLLPDGKTTTADRLRRSGLR